jgi:hypothetical protein
MPARHAFLWLAAPATLYLTPPRLWLDRLAWIVPAPTASRWLLVADAAALIAIALASRRPGIAVPVALGLGFLVVNVAGMLVTDFYLGLAMAHVAIAAAALLLARGRRWVGALALGVTVAVGIVT